MKFFSKIFKNKSMVTLIAMIVCLAILYFAYNYRVNKAIQAVDVPIATRKIEAREEIKAEDIKTKKVASAMITENVIRRKEDLEGKYVNYNTFIPEGSLFYRSAVVTWDEMPDSSWNKIEDGNTIVSLAVNSTTTFGNSIYPGTVIDLYYKNYNAAGKLFIGILIKDIKVLAVKDDAGNHIFTRSADQRQASALIFQVPEYLHLLLKRALYVGGNGSLFPVPRMHKADYQAETKIYEKDTNYIVNFINANAMRLCPDDNPNCDVEVTKINVSE